jgi:hypothetical protein
MGFSLQKWEALKPELIAIITAAGGVMGDEIGGAAPTTHGDFPDPATLRGDPKLVTAAFQAIPNTGPEAPNYDDYLDIVRATRFGGGEEVYDAFLDWGLLYDGGREPPTPEGIRAKWESCNTSTIGATWLYARARQHGFMDDAKTAFTPIPDEPAPQGGAVGPSTFSQWVYIVGVKRFGHKETRQLLDKEQFNDLHSHLGPLKGEKSAAALYLKDHGTRQWCTGITYRPNGPLLYQEHDGLAFNIWRPSALKLPPRVTDADVAWYMDLLAHVLPDKRQQDIWLDWTAAVLQHPERKINWAILFKSNIHGVGKDMLALPLQRGLGDHNVSIVTTDLLQSSFNQWAANVKLAIVSEMQAFENKSLYNRLKAYDAAPPEWITINGKHMAPYRIPNILASLRFTNLINAMMLEQGDRRTCVLESPAVKKDPAYYREFKRRLDGEGCGQVVRWLLQRDLTDFNWGGAAPDTEAKEAMRRVSLPALETAILEAIEDEAPPLDIDIVTMAEIMSVLQAGLNGRRGTLSREKVGAILKKEFRAVCSEQVRIEPGRGGKRAFLWVIRNHDKYAGWTTPQLRDEYIRLRGLKPVITGEVVDIFGDKA